MPPAKKTKAVTEFGDFQTPPRLAEEVCGLLAERTGSPGAVLDPTCGIGNFLVASLKVFPSARSFVGVELNPEYVSQAGTRIRAEGHAAKAEVIHADFFNTDWAALLDRLPSPVLIVGNPPWVTNAALGKLGSTNLPEKTNFQQHVGLDAVTGKSNFDISEWMLIRLLEQMDGRAGALAMLCKTAVARKALFHAWKNNFALKRAELHGIDTASFFNSAVDACLLVCELDSASHSLTCQVFRNLGDRVPASQFGYEDGLLLADVGAYRELKRFRGKDAYRWRSGVKHDCGKVMELVREGPRYRNGFGELVELEEEYVYPALKSSDLANGRADRPRRCMLVPQRAVGDDTSALQHQAPKTWQYLLAHAGALDRRASAIYRGRPRFAVFGVGEYTFAPWKVAISGLYKKLAFSVVGPHQGKPVVLDDTCYFLPCRSQPEAELLAGLLNSETAQRFFSAFIFWDAKRPITVSILEMLNLSALGEAAAIAASS